MATGRPSVLANFLKSLIAVLAGNAVYFLLVDLRLPAHARHQLFAFDLGLVIDAWICLIFYGALAMLWQRKRKSKPGS